MTTIVAEVGLSTDAKPQAVDHVWRRVVRSGRIVIGGGVLLAIVLVALVTLPWTLDSDKDFYFNRQDSTLARGA